MDVVVAGPAGQEAVLPVAEDATLLDLLKATQAEFGCPLTDTALWAGGRELTSEGPATRLADVEGFEAGCRVEVRLDPTRYAKKITDGTAAWGSLPEWARESRECAVALMGVDPASFVKLPALSRGDSDIALAAVQANGTNLEHVCGTLSDDPTVVRAACASDPAALRFAGPEMRGDVPLLLGMLECSPSHLGCAPSHLLCDREFAVRALRASNGWGFRHLSGELRADRELAIYAVRRYVPAFEFCNSALRGDRAFVLQLLRDVVSITLHQRLPALRSWWEQLRGAPALLPKTFRFNYPRDSLMLRHVLNGLNADREIVMLSLSCWGESLRYASDALRADKGVVMAAVQSMGDALQYASPELRANKAVAYAALRNKCSIDHIDPSLLDDTEVFECKTRVIRDGAPAFLRTNLHKLMGDKEFVLEFVRLSQPAVSYLRTEAIIAAGYQTF
eukprot:TRINITY_DN4487_c0_g1_i4.p1 TRINITY_DN4487_c0_g1~~TRINITY_DN4487_c0_g1_i4.p1  ORF type:complete len:449 (+),score=154.38 TRINITY_DN4487_c0_g1_i4:163-1509(+)